MGLETLVEFGYWKFSLGLVEYLQTVVYGFVV